MPKFHVLKKVFFDRLGKQMSEEELNTLLFTFGIEQEPEGEEFVFEISANRADLLCVEGLTYALRTYLGLEGIRKYQRSQGSVKMFVTK